MKEFIRRQRYFLMILFSVMIVCLSLYFPNTYSKFTADKETGSVARVAFFAGEHHSTDFPSNELLPGETETVVIQVTNKDQDKLLETAIRYRLRLEVFGNLPLVYQLFKVAGGTKTPVDFPDLTTAYQTMAEKNTETVHTYHLQIHWPEEKNDYYYSNDMKVSRISIETEQVD